jgi:glycolate oxidase iron-sulfur subunit
MAKAVATCVHCGFCLPACPTYRTLGEEMDSPRGRIFLMKSALEGAISVEEAMPYVDRCLGCLACVPACPSGVAYGDLLTPFRAHAEARVHRPFVARLRRELMMATLPYPARFRAAARIGRLARHAQVLVPRALRPMLGLIPSKLPAKRPLPRAYPATDRRRARVALLAGCAQQVLAPNIAWAALRVLARCGVEVVVPPEQGCCGALAMHVGDANRARRLARANLRAFPPDVDAIVTTAAGCGSGMHDYPLLFKGLPEEEAATSLAAKTLDVIAFLDRLGIPELPPLSSPQRVAYHDACHLANAQDIRLAPRALLQRIPNLHLIEIADGGFCCGSAGTYNVDQPEIAADLGRRKADAIRATGADAVCTGNIGCLVQIATHLKRLSGGAPHAPMAVLHSIELIDRALSTSQPIADRRSAIAHPSANDHR